MTGSLLINTAGGDSDKGPVRKANEDSFLLPDADSPTRHGDIYVVADGVGGQKNGAEASQLAVRIIHDEFYKARSKGKDIPTALQRAADEANLAIYDASLGRGMGRMGCTVVTAVHHENQRTILHAGDARAYLLRDEELHQLTRDDTWIQMQVEEGLIGEDTAANHRLRHVITRVLGNKPTLEATISEPMPIEAGDVLLLCSDGLYDVVSSEKIQQTLYWNPPQEAAEILIKLAIQAPATDNITAVVIESHLATEEKQPLVAMPGSESKTAVSPQRRRNIRLLLWIIIVIITTLLLIDSPLRRQFIKSNEPLPTTVAPAASPLNKEMDPSEIDLVESANTPAATATAAFSPACIVNPNGTVYVWQDDQINNNNCDQSAREGFELNDGDQVIIIDPTSITILGPDAALCQENQFIKVQSATDKKIAGWVLEKRIQVTTQEQGCPP